MKPEATDNVLALARPAIRALAAYPVGSVDSVMADLATNELPGPACPATAGLERYPDPLARALREALATWLDVDPDAVLPTRGGDEVIEAVVRVFCEPGRDRVVVCPPCFSMYAISARVHAAGVVAIPLDGELQPDVPGILRAVDAGARVVFLCAPNNPTGDDIAADVLTGLLDALEERAVVVLDEAYAEFADRPSMVGLVTRHPSLVVLRTFSKAHGLAGLRVGYAVAAPEVVALMRKVLPPYPLPTPCQEEARAALAPERLAATGRRVRALRRRRERLAAALAGSPAVAEVRPSQANFLMLVPEQGEDLIARAAGVGLRIRALDDPALPAGCVRVTVGDDDQCRRLVYAMSGPGREVADGTP